jgi:hypothetical protein|eukprot:SAG25_NODE_104_length_15398_cov_15.424472_4_plen_269_part_00
MVPLGNLLSPISLCALLPAHKEEAQKRALSECVSTAVVCWDKRKRLEAVPRGTIVSPDSSILVDKSMSSARCTSRCPTAPVTSSTRWHDVLTPPLSLRSASTSSRRRWSSCVPAQHTHNGRSVAHYGCQLGPQHPHSYAQMPAPLMLLRPARTWTGLSGQPKVLGAVMPPASWRSGWPQQQRAGQQRAHTESRGCVASHVSSPAPPFRCDWAWYLRQHGPHTCTQYRRTILDLHRGARGVQAALAQQRSAWRAAAASFTWATTSLSPV